MRIGERIKNLFRRRSPPTAEELAARAEAESERARIREEIGIKSQVDGGQSGPQIPPF